MADRVVPMLHVPDVRVTVTWYQALGFALRGSHEDGGKLTWAALALGASELMLNAGGRPSDAPRRDVDLYVHTRDVDARFHRLPATVVVQEPPHDTEYGQREFIIRDVNGFWLTFGEPTPGSGAAAR